MEREQLTLVHGSLLSRFFSFIIHPFLMRGNFYVIGIFLLSLPIYLMREALMLNEMEMKDTF